MSAGPYRSVTVCLRCDLGRLRFSSLVHVPGELDEPVPPQGLGGIISLRSRSRAAVTTAHVHAPRFPLTPVAPRPPFGPAQVGRLTGDDRLCSVEDTTPNILHPSLCPRCAQHLARLYLSAFVGGQAIVRPDELCRICQIRLQEFARCHRREVA
jgi:hypothetical protein